MQPIPLPLTLIQSFIPLNTSVISAPQQNKFARALQTLFAKCMQAFLLAKVERTFLQIFPCIFP